MGQLAKGAPPSAPAPSAAPVRFPGLPAWVRDGFNKEEMVAACEPVQGVPFLRQGRRPAVGQRLYVQLRYAHDGSHPEEFRGWARMTGEVTRVYPPPPAGVYGTYPGEDPDLPEEQLRALRASLPPLPESIALTCACGCLHTRAAMLERKAAVHGQRLRARLRLTCDDAGLLEPQLAGEWEAEFILNDTLTNPWVRGGRSGGRLGGGGGACMPNARPMRCSSRFKSRVCR